MKHTLLLFALFLSAIFAHAQTVDGISIDDKKEVVFCELIVIKKPFKSEFIAGLDYGQYQKGKQYVEEDGKEKEFNSEIHAINYMVSLGWELYHVFEPASTSNGVELHYLFKRKTSDG